LNGKVLKIFRTIIFPPVFYECEAWSLILKEEYELKVLENRVLRRIFGLKLDEIIRGSTKLHNEELQACSFRQI
jgi:hypothetical protein